MRFPSQFQPTTLFSFVRIDESSRVSESGEVLFPPSTLLGWDQNTLSCESLSPKEMANLRWSSLMMYSVVPLMVRDSAWNFTLVTRRHSNTWNMELPIACEFAFHQQTGHGPLQAIPQSHSYHACVRSALASHLFWLLAKDLFIRTCLPNYRGLFVKAPGMSQWDMELIDCQMIPILPFLAIMFGKKHWEAEVEETFANAHINFSHWVTMESTIAEKGRHQSSGNELTLHLWNRTSAIQCYRAEQTGSGLSELASIHQGNEYIDCTSDVPYIAILVNWGLEHSEFKDTWCPTGPDGPFLRVYAAGVNVTTFPFLKERRLVEEFCCLVFPEKVPSYKSTEIGKGCHMCAMATGMMNLNADDWCTT
ncbi:hypothetical protein SCLCIDRAFT_1189203 [Scleroderma citrinum Foug A]|uniref:Uncharacterized protein n=1 Tax=Scleroderma citrinum Foug A TaxID=1036808 RepID=A0A0C3DDM9_9AGAM|nr:hypothetical protein SCLCIDRAFT_1189203 [Scleroderma citrinum Foug A]